MSEDNNSNKTSKFPVSSYDHGSKFTNRQGSYYISSLFVDLVGERDDGVVMYSLNAKDHPSGKYTNLHKAYLEMEDATEWEFAFKYFANWDHWVMICNSPKISPFVEKWRRELEVKLRSRALKEIVQVAQEGGNRSFEANKFLVGTGWVSAEDKRQDAKTKRGRPTKESIKDKAVREFIENGEQVDKDLAKLMEHRKS